MILDDTKREREKVEFEIFRKRYAFFFQMLGLNYEQEFLFTGECNTERAESQIDDIVMRSLLYKHGLHEFITEAIKYSTRLKNG